MGGDASPGLAGLRVPGPEPPTRTRPCEISPAACSRDRASPRRTSSASSLFRLAIWVVAWIAGSGVDRAAGGRAAGGRAAGGRAAGGRAARRNRAGPAPLELIEQAVQPLVDTLVRLDVPGIRELAELGEPGERLVHARFPRC